MPTVEATRRAIGTLASAATIAAVVLVGGSSRAHALDCGGRIVEIGATAANVISVCGDPVALRFEGIDVQIWTYVTEDFAVELRFERDILVSERSLRGGAGGHRDREGRRDRGGDRDHDDRDRDRHGRDRDHDHDRRFR